MLHRRTEGSRSWHFGTVRTRYRLTASCLQPWLQAYSSNSVGTCSLVAKFSHVSGSLGIRRKGGPGIVAWLHRDMYTLANTSMFVSTLPLQAESSWQYRTEVVARCRTRRCTVHQACCGLPLPSLSFTLDVKVVILIISSVRDRVRPVSGRVERAGRQLRVHGTSRRWLFW